MSCYNLKQKKKRNLFFLWVSSPSSSNLFLLKSLCFVVTSKIKFEGSAAVGIFQQESDENSEGVKQKKRQKKEHHEAKELEQHSSETNVKTPTVILFDQNIETNFLSFSSSKAYMFHNELYVIDEFFRILVKGLTFLMIKQ